jgi:transposase-like protein
MNRIGAFIMKKTHSAKEKAEIVIEALQGGKTINELAAANGINPNLVYKWKGQAIKGLPNLFMGDDGKTQTLEKAHEAEVTELQAEIGKLTMQLEWAKKKAGL